MIEGNQDNFEKEVIKSKVPVLVDFNAEWCGPCQATAAILEPLAEKHDEFKIVSVDVDDQEELAEQYDVTTIPCLVIFKDGKEIARDSGMISEKRILKMIGLK